MNLFSKKVALKFCNSVLTAKATATCGCGARITHGYSEPRVCGGLALPLKLRWVGGGEATPGELLS